MTGQTKRTIDTGNEGIDNGGLDVDHDQQHALIQRFLETMRDADDRQAALDLLEALRVLSRRHFAREERVQASIRFPDMAEHHAQHQRLLALLDQAVDALAKADAPSDIRQAKSHADDLLRTGFLGHFAKADMAMRAHMARYVAW